ncbi:MAG: sulfotransferase [Anaerolineales bacterium]|jgi:hypothetical protein
MALLICGHQRSGTTILADVVGRHPDIRLTVEFANFWQLGLSYRVYVRWILGRWWLLRRRNNLLVPVALGPLNFLRNHLLVPCYLLAYTRFWRERVSVAAIEGALRCLFPRARVVGDKFPDYLSHLPELTASPQAQCLVIYRDCRDVASSTLRMARTTWRTRGFVQGLDTPEKVARRWVKGMQIMDQFADRIHVVRYEDLVQDPGPVLKGIGDWLGLDPQGFPSRYLQADKIGKHREGLTPEELRAVIEVAGPTMERFGYRL